MCQFDDSMSLSVKAKEICGCSTLKTGLQISFFLHCWIIDLLIPNLEPKSSQYHHGLILIHKLTGKLGSFWEHLCMAFPLFLKCKNNFSISLPQIYQGEHKCRNLVEPFRFETHSLFLWGKSATNLDWSFSIIHSELNPCSYPNLNVRDRK